MNAPNTTSPGPSLANSLMLIAAAVIGIAVAWTAALFVLTLAVRYCAWIVHLAWSLWR